jgi:chaperonin GroEL
VEVSNDEQHFGVQVVIGAVQAPIRQIATNAGMSPDIAVGKIENEEGSIGIDFSVGEVVDLFDAGVIDPLKVTKTALKNAVSVASTLLTADYAIIE